MNNRGFTLIELLATLVILTLIVSISGYSVISIINKSKTENYNNLLRNIRDASEEYYMECKYNNDNIISCNLNGNSMTISLGDLVRYGFLKGNNVTGNNKIATLIDPNTELNIESCQITVTYSNDKINITNNSTDSKCPKQSDYDKILK